MIRTRLQGDIPFFPNMLNNGKVEVCLKEDVDKVIVEKDKEIAELKDKLQAADKQIENLINSASSIMLFQDRVNDDKCAELRHSNYKRCLAMARWCENRSDQLFEDTLSVRDIGFEPSDELTFKLEFFRKWHKRWLELALQLL